MSAPVSYFPDFLDQNMAELNFAILWNILPWERREDAPRKEIWMNKRGHPYTYGKGAGVRTYEAHPFASAVLTIERDIVRFLDCEGIKQFEGCFLNGYEGSRDHLGWHSDDDPLIDHTRPIAVVTLYSHQGEGERSIQFRSFERDNEDTIIITSVPESRVLEQGSLLIMHPGMQFTHQHRIPKSGMNVRKRISLTFRGLRG